MDCYILKQNKSKGIIMPEDLLVLNDEGAVAVFTNTLEAGDFIDDNDLIGADIKILW